VERVFDIAAVPFEQVGSEEKKRYEANRRIGASVGYKLLRYWVSSQNKGTAKLWLSVGG